MWHFWITHHTKIFACLVCIVFWLGNENDILVFPMGWKHCFPVISICRWLIQKVNDERATNDGIKERMTKGLPRRQFEEMQTWVMENEIALQAGDREPQDKSVATNLWQEHQKTAVRVCLLQCCGNRLMLWDLSFMYSSALVVNLSAVTEPAGVHDQPQS